MPLPFNSIGTNSNVGGGGWYMLTRDFSYTPWIAEGKEDRGMRIQGREEKRRKKERWRREEEARNNTRTRILLPYGRSSSI